MLDCLIVGAGPAGSVAATVLARAGARVRIVDRSMFPRDKLCGDTVNPGTLGLLRRLNMAAAIDGCGLPVAGMRVTGERGVVIEGRYRDGVSGRALLRRHLDWMLLQDALAAGAQFEPGCAVRGAIMDGSGVAGVRVSGRPFDGEVRARVTIAADGRRSTLAFGLGMARHPARPRRWAMGVYVENTAAAGPPRDLGEMHVRAGRYIGIAPVPGGLTNVCVVRPWRPGDRVIGDPKGAVLGELARDPLLRDRFSGARLTGTPAVLGPLAVDVNDAVHVDGLLLAGDAAGFIDPMTGDGLRFAVRGAELAALSALDALEHGWQGVHERLAIKRRAEFAAKWRFNRLLRSLVTSPVAVGGASWGARLAPGGLRAAIEYAGDVRYA
jgi:flavin-dependent dehydrogenase